MTPSESLGRGKISGWCPIPFFDWGGDAWVTGLSPSHRFERLPKAYRPTEARKPQEWLRMDKAGGIRRKEFTLASTRGILGVRCRSDGRVNAGTLVLESNFANSVARVSSLG